MRVQAGLLIALSTLASACSPQASTAPNETSGAKAEPLPVADSYVAEVSALNADKTGFTPAGKATFTVKGDSLIVHVKMTGTPPDIEHWEHFHGFPEGKEANCATAANDANKDGFVDLIETGSAMGTTMVPFNDAPHHMDIPTDTYPRADAKGSYEYTKTVPLAELEAKFGETYNGAKIDLSKRVFMVHGVPTTMKLPASVQGQVGKYDVFTTLPIACGKITRVQ